MRAGRVLVRNFEAVDHLETVLVAAVTSVLAIRLFLHLAGYPQIGGRTLHIAHVLWGGLLMLAALLLLLGTLGRASRRLAAIIGGIGFGAFVDEIGKFLTRDNDYFYQPAVAVIYVVFVLIFLAVRGLHRGSAYSSQENLLNALRETEEFALHDLDPEEKERALRLLAESDPGHPLVSALRSALHSAEPVAPGPTSPLAVARGWIRGGYRAVTRFPGFDAALVLFFVGQLVVKLAYAALLILFVGLGWRQILDWSVVGRLAARLEVLSGLELAQFGASGLAGAFVLLGVVWIRRSRLAAYRMFERAMLVSILLVQPLTFYVEQFAALIELAFNVTILTLLRTAIRVEESRALI